MRYDAHGLGGAGDLPIPAEYAIAGASAALAVSFIVMSLAWRSPRFEVPAGSPVAAVGRVVDSRWFSPVVRGLGLAFAGWVAMAAVFGRDSLVNPTFGVFYVLLWVGIVPASLLLGPFYKAVSPVRTLHLLLMRASGADPSQGLRELPARLGYWPAVLGLFAFVWIELVSPHGTELGSVRLWLAAYVGIMLVGSAVFGDRWFEHADPFEVYSTFVAHLSPWARVDGRLQLVNPLANLTAIPVRPGIVAVVAVLLGSTAFDSFRESSFWLTRVQGSGIDKQWLDLAAMVGIILVVGLLFSGATMLTGVHGGQSRRALPGAYAHSLLPIIVGYMVAHYLTSLVEYGQTTVIQLADPLGQGWNLLGIADRAPADWLSQHPSTLAVIKVLGVVVGHVVAVVSAHDTAMRVLPRRDQLTGQLALLLVMVFFTTQGLALLFSEPTAILDWLSAPFE